MKKILTVCMAIVMVLGLSTAVLAAPGNFVSSPSGNAAPTIVGFDAANADCTLEPVIIPYKDRDQLPDDQRKHLEDAYDDIVNADDLSDLVEALKDVADKLGVDVDDLAVSDLFYITGKGCDDHDGHKGFTITLDANTLKNFAALMQMDENGNWSLVNGAYINSKGQLVFTLDDLNRPLAIVVNGANVSPQTGDTNHIYIYAALMVASALAIVVIAVKSKKYA